MISRLAMLQQPRIAAMRTSGVGAHFFRGTPRWLSTTVSSRDLPEEDIVQLEDNAVERLEMLQKKKENDKLKLRLAVEGGGCSGFSYKFTVSDEDPSEEDYVFENSGKVLLVDDSSLELVKGSKIVFTEDLIRRSFEVIDNPNADTGCGCGASFSAKSAEAAF
mmetsp:Transcript_21698/g.38324  ORF Transcript_21698/g.38324 Transcript_21698/m.38324 type:complete len:163 (+) Transcript_21698:113-601(+)